MIDAAEHSKLAFDRASRSTGLSGLADSADAVHTRYADDLAFSGGVNFQRTAQRFHLHACATVMEEGFLVHHRKTRIMR